MMIVMNLEEEVHGINHDNDSDDAVDTNDTIDEEVGPMNAH